ncbi:hypothetical protein ACFWVP_05430 [Streptomyces sp. NPDC058637]|uniref:hypothetical protein n=1 Tax=Streptomyces sp. NPDC058637 TaxID=3346569 RepID=UPI00364877E8
MADSGRDGRRPDETSVQVRTEAVDRLPGERVGVVRDDTVRRRSPEPGRGSGTGARFRVAMKRKPSPALLERLAHDADESVRPRVRVLRTGRAHARGDTGILRRDPWSEVRAAVAGRPEPDPR